MVSFYMDVHVPAAVTDALRRRGIDVRTSREDGAETLADEELLARTTTQGRVLVTQDQDFHRIAPEWQAAGTSFAGIVFAAQLDVGIGRMIDDLHVPGWCAEPDEIRDRLIRLPLN